MRWIGLLFAVGCARPFVVADWTRARGDEATVTSRASWRIEIPQDMAAELRPARGVKGCLESELADDMWCRTELGPGCMEIYERPGVAMLLVWPDACRPARPARPGVTRPVRLPGAR